MAKKKVKKKAARTRKLKRTLRKKPRAKKIYPQKLLLQKINNIKERVPHIEPTGECKDPQTGEVLFRFTEAQRVFEIYQSECAMEGLIYRPYYGPLAPVAIPAGRGVFAAFPFCVQDLETGELIAGWGFGGGMNADWSGNTAHTRALKQFLLTFFQTTWTDPEQITKDIEKQQLREQVLKELEADGTLANIEQIRFWTQKFGQKGVPDEQSTRKRNTKGRASRSHKKNRGAKKRHSQGSR